MKKNLAQYFTPEIIADFMVKLSNVNPKMKILEPSSGTGVFLDILSGKGCNNITAYEIDSTLQHKFDYVINTSFVSANINDKYDLVIGNPPYIRWKNLEKSLKDELLDNDLWNKYCNSLCDYLSIFIIKSISLLKNNGVLVFICPEYWINTTHSAALRNYMIENGIFENIFHFNETPIFDKVTTSSIIFKYRKVENPTAINYKVKISKFSSRTKITSEVLERLLYESTANGSSCFEIEQFKNDSRWLLFPNEKVNEINRLENACSHVIDGEKRISKIKDFCDIGNGMVSGLDKAFQWHGINETELEKKALIKVIKAKDLRQFFSIGNDKYIFVKDKILAEYDFEKCYPNFFNHFKMYKKDLMNRYNYNKFINYWDWSFLRNYKLFSKNASKIFVPCKERISHKDYFRFSLVTSDFYPTQDVTALFKKDGVQESIEYILAYLNQRFVFDWISCCGVVKGNIVEFSEKPLASIPFRRIDWNNANEVKIHDEITTLARELVETMKLDNALDISDKFKILMGF